MNTVPTEVEMLIYKCLPYHDLAFCKTAVALRNDIADASARKIQQLFHGWKSERDALRTKLVLSPMHTMTKHEFVFFMTWIFPFHKMRATWPAFYALKMKYDEYVKPIMERFEVWTFIRDARVTMENVRKIGW